MIKHFWKALTVGFKRRWWDGAKFGFGAIGAAWTLTEILTRANDKLDKFLDHHGDGYLGLMLVLGFGVFFAYVIEPLAVSFKVPTTDTRITLKYGDLFAENAHIVVGVNEYFDGELGDPVKASSVHGQFISRSFQGNAAAFRAAVDPALQAIGAQPTPQARPVEPSNAYAIGTTPFVRDGTRLAFLMAMARTPYPGRKAASDVPTLWTALQGGFRAIHLHGNGEPVAMPLFGNGQAGINLKPQHLLRLLTLALVDFGRNSNTPLPKEVIVVLHDRCFEELDIREIRRDWQKT